MVKVKISNLKISYQNNKSTKFFIINGLEVEAGKIVGFFGPNHVGKSTLLKVIGQLHSDLRISNEARILFNDEPYNKKTNSPLILHVPQDFTNSLFPWFSIKENLRIIMKALKLENTQIDKNILTFCEIFGYNNEDELLKYHGFFENNSLMKITDLSGGQQQIVTIMRTLMSCPEVITMDEPFSAIDVYKGTEFRGKVLNFLEKRRITSFIVSHELEDLITLCDEIFFFNYDKGGDILKGKETIGTPREGPNIEEHQVREYSKRLKSKYEIS